MENLIVRIVLPKGLAVDGGAALNEDVTFEVVGSINPWYVSIDQVKLESGSYIRGISDITIAARIYDAGREADTLTYARPPVPPSGASPGDSSFDRYQRFLIARQRYVAKKVALDLILNVWDVNSSRGVKTLGNFSVTRYLPNQG